MYATVTAQQAVALVRSGQRVFVQGAAATPMVLLDALVQRASELRDVEMVHLHLEGSAPHAAPELAASFRINALFVGANVRAAVAEGRADYLPVFLSEAPALFRQRVLPLDVALIHVSPPDKHGYCSLGTSVDVAAAAVETATTVIAQINPRMPRTLGYGQVHVSRFAACVDVDLPLPNSHRPPPSVAEQQIARHVASLVEDGATIQTGIGGIPDAVLAALHGHRRLGVHTEMFSDGLLPLVASGAVTGECKKLQRGKILSSFVVGSQALYDFVHDNPIVELRDSAYVNDTHVIRQNPNVTAINSALEIDLTGQVCADSLGEMIYSGVGGQMDFIRGASLSPNGRAIIALRSTAKGLSRIVPTLRPGSGVVTT
nr:acetyl-CoA hydrolase/transferase C-terminal domain-containing protein [Kofleriaceae bacterium]